MKYSLRSLMIVAILAPPLLALAIVAVRHLLEPKPRPITVMPTPQKIVMVRFGFGGSSLPSQPGEIEVQLPDLQEKKEAGSAALQVLRFWRNEAGEKHGATEMSNSSAPAPNPPRK